MLSQLNQEVTSLPVPSEVGSLSPYETLLKNGIPLFPLPETSHVHLMEQYSERYKQTHNKLHKNKTKSTTSYSHSAKQQPETISKLLQLQPTFRVESSSVYKGESRSFLLKTKNSSKFYRRLPKIPKLALQQGVLQQKTMHVVIRQKMAESQMNKQTLKIESKCCEIKLNVETKQAQLPKLQKKPGTIPKSFAPTGSIFSRTNSITKSPNNKRQMDYLDTKDSLNRSIIKPIPIKYKKGYLIYDSNCYSCFKNRNQIPERKVTLPVQPPVISARDYCILDLYTLKPLYVNKFNSHPIEIASLTKIVTCLLTILACKKYDVVISEYKCRVSEEASSMIGTSAELSSGDVLTIDELLYGLMLPSGNDAAVALAENIGRIIQRKKKMQNPPHPVLTFVKQMNILYRQIINQQDQQSHVFKNPSGLMMNPNTTTVEQITIFAAIACQNQTFSRIMNTTVFDVNIMNERFGISRKMQWRNTNKLLWKGWEGVKTGTTENAGHCFIGKYENNIFALLDCSTLQRRFSDAELLKKWICKQSPSELITN